jgi:hypothetical protein
MGLMDPRGMALEWGVEAMGLGIKRISSTSHPTLEFQQHKFVGAFNQGQVVDRAVTMPAMVKSEMEVLTAQSADLRVAAHHHIQG